MIPAYEAARHHAAVIDRSDRGRLVVSGADRATYLQGLLTNDIVRLKAGEGCYAAYLTPHGRMVADLLVYELGDVMLLTAIGDVRETLLAKFDQFIFSEDVKLGDVSGTFAEIAVVGPDAARVLGGVMDGAPGDVLSALPEHGNVRASYGGQPAIVARVTDTGQPGFDVFVDRSKADGFMSALTRAGVTPLDAEAAEAIRIETGVPLFHRDMDEETIPLEAGIEARAISQTKGCYVGQEVIIRVLHRGHGRVARRLAGLTLADGEPPAAGAAIRASDKDIGHVTSSVRSPALGRPIALGYVHRDFVEPGTSVMVNGAEAIVSKLPFV